jgi:hypothetical protein
MSQKISPVSLRLCNIKGFKQNFYEEHKYIQLWKKNMELVSNTKKIIENYGLLKLRRNQINRRLRLKHNLCITPINNMADYILSNLPYKNKLNTFIFKKPLYGVQFNYSIRQVQRRKKQVYFKK